MLQKTITLGIEAVNDVTPLDHELYVEGAVSILNKPEFAEDAASFRKTFLALQEKEKLVEILETCLIERRAADPDRLGERLHTGPQLQYRRPALRHHEQRRSEWSASSARCAWNTRGWRRSSTTSAAH